MQFLYNHVQDLGFDCHSSNFYDCGLIGLENQRKILSLISDCMNSDFFPGEGIIIHGPVDSGKASLMKAFSSSLKKDIPFIYLSASEILLNSLDPYECLLQSCRKALKIQLKQDDVFIKGEVVELDITYSKSPEKMIKDGSLTLKTSDMVSTYNIGPKLGISLINAKVSIGELISINLKTYQIKRFGKLNGEKSTIGCPSGDMEVFLKKTNQFTLNELDSINITHSHMDKNTQRAFDEKIKNQEINDSFELKRGILYIDNVHLLDSNIFYYIKNICEERLHPFIILSSRNTGHKSFLDIFEGFLFIETFFPSFKDIDRILRLILNRYSVSFENELYQHLNKIIKQKGFKCVLQFLLMIIENSKDTGTNNDMLRKVEKFLE